MSETSHTVSIMNLDFMNVTQQEFIERHLVPKLRHGYTGFVVTANPEIAMRAREDQAYQDVLAKADYIVPDGIGIIKASEWMGSPLKERVTGFDLMKSLLKLAQENGYSCYFLGASEKSNESAVEKVKEQYPGIRIAGRHHGFFGGNDKSVPNAVRAADADLVFVALGMPRQEMWISEHIQHFNKGIFMGVGGSFDVLAGEVKRAPDVWIKFNMEWAYRLMKQPFRWKRILKVFQFMFLILLGKGKEKTR